MNNDDTLALRVRRINEFGERVNLAYQGTQYLMVIPDERNPVEQHYDVYNMERTLVGRFNPDTRTIVFAAMSSPSSSSSSSVSSRQTRRRRSRSSRSSGRSRSHRSLSPFWDTDVSFAEAPYPPNINTCIKCAEYQMPAEMQNFQLQRLGERIETPLEKGQVYVIQSNTDNRNFVAKFVEMTAPTVARFMGFCELGVATHFEHEATVNLTTHHVHPCPDGLFALYTLHIGGPSTIQLEPCAICLSLLIDKNAMGSTIQGANDVWNVHPGAEVGHYFHKGCINMHCQGRRPTCPICRQNITCP